MNNLSWPTLIYNCAANNGKLPNFTYKDAKGKVEEFVGVRVKEIKHGKMGESGFLATLENGQYRHFFLKRIV